MFRCMAGQRLTVAIMLPGLKMQMTGLTSHCHNRTYGPPLQSRGLTEEVSEKIFRKEAAQAAGEALMDGGQAALACVG